MITVAAKRRVLPRVAPGLMDGALALVLGVIAVIERLTPYLDIKAGPLAVNIPMTITVVGLVALRRIAPVRVLLLSCAVIGLPTFLVHHDFLFWSHMLPLAIETYTVARHRGLRTAVPAALAPVAAVSIVFGLDGQTTDPGSLFFLLLFAFAVAAGEVLRRYAAQRDELAAAVAHLAADRVRRQRMVVLSERARAARDLQAIVEDAVSLMLVQAEAAAESLERDPVRAEKALLALEGVGRGATGELRHMLGLLRAEPDEHPGRGS